MNLHYENSDINILKLIKKALESDSTVTNIEMFVNLEGDDVITYFQDGIKKLITIDHLD